MKTIQRFKLAAAAAAIGLSFSAVAATADAGKPSVVIVHGAFADGSDWAKVIPLLQAKGLHVVAVQNPLSSLEDDVAAAKRAIDAQPGKVVLVATRGVARSLPKRVPTTRSARWSMLPPSRPTPGKAPPKPARASRPRPASRTSWPTPRASCRSPRRA